MIKALMNKQDYLTLFNHLNKPLLQYYTKGKTRISFGNTGVGYGKNRSGLEGFSRVLWGAGPAIELIGSNWQEIIIEGIRNGTNSKHKEYWGDIEDRDQRMVEMPAIALSLLYGDCFIWNRLSDNEKANVVAWLNQIFDHTCADGNWQFFKIIVKLVLDELKVVSTGSIEEALDNIEKCYLADGWYQDSSRGRQDYYTPFAFHYYGLIFSKLVPEQRMSQLFRDRANEYAKEYLYFFADEGANIPFGRSLIYRHAAVCFWSALIYAEVFPFDIGVMKGIINRNLRWWLEKDIFDSEGILSLGYTYTQQMLTEPYNSSQSPYWSNKVFLLLALSDNHEFWRTDEKQLPNKDNVYLLESPKLLAVNDEGHSYLLNAGQAGPNYHTLTNEKYLKFAFSSHFGFSIPRTNQLKEEFAMDSSIGIQKIEYQIPASRNGEIIEEVSPLLVRSRVSDICTNEKFVASTWQLNPLNRIRTWLVSIQGWQIRIHRLEIDSETSIYETGFAVENNPDLKNFIEDKYEGNYTYGKAGFSGIIDLSTKDRRSNKLIECLPNTNLMTKEPTLLPGLETILPKGNYWLYTGIYAHPDEKHGLEVWENIPQINHDYDINEVVLSLLEDRITIKL